MVIIIGTLGMRRNKMQRNKIIGMKRKIISYKFVLNFSRIKGMEINEKEWKEKIIPEKW